MSFNETENFDGNFTNDFFSFLNSTNIHDEDVGRAAVNRDYNRNPIPPNDDFFSGLQNNGFNFENDQTIFFIVLMGLCIMGVILTAYMIVIAKNSKNNDSCQEGEKDFTETMKEYKGLSREFREKKGKRKKYILRTTSREMQVTDDMISNMERHFEMEEAGYDKNTSEHYPAPVDYPNILGEGRTHCDDVEILEGCSHLTSLKLSSTGQPRAETGGHLNRLMNEYLAKRPDLWKSAVGSAGVEMEERQEDRNFSSPHDHRITSEKLANVHSLSNEKQANNRSLHVDESRNALPQLTSADSLSPLVFLNQYFGLWQETSEVPPAAQN
eukprot:CAMPEP_0113303906 /NCGR_PEP_ID=MMETSP0010_2-20120614/4122_1 /TAXON_ID=216773 ORGANISM="Corethron hystrix, Strain 308" /NCGR_SAMPLE_ID=MMETSP0010_2 /ASSEMBLY_ACC=CAM_ASM_000155 /LENGTH=325 /DNA_ID=CAMNT_0000157971 /DNA_START=211 /DNA_END=1188 /DNA_ORIENTATION=+ /assembly_acc=CAM_ASM_000155